MAKSLNIMVTNDDGIDSAGLHVLARAMKQFGHVTVVAPDREFSGTSAAIGAIWEDHPEVHHGTIEGIDTVWMVSGPPALCVFYARLGAFDFQPDLVVSGINPGANVGRAVYHSGTVGAALTARNGGIPGVAVSQAVNTMGVEGQAWADITAELDWETAASIATKAVEGLIAADLVGPEASRADDFEPLVLNLNVPAAHISEITEWAWTEVGSAPRQSLTKVTLSPKQGHVGSFQVTFDYGEPADLPDGTDTHAVSHGKVSLTWLGRITALNHGRTVAAKSVDEALGGLLG